MIIKSQRFLYNYLLYFVSIVIFICFSRSLPLFYRHEEDSARRKNDRIKENECYRIWALKINIYKSPLTGWFVDSIFACFSEFGLIGFASWLAAQAVPLLRGEWWSVFLSYYSVLIFCHSHDSHLEHHRSFYVVGWKSVGVGQVSNQRTLYRETEQQPSCCKRYRNSRYWQIMRCFVTL